MSITMEKGQHLVYQVFLQLQADVNYPRCSKKEKGEILEATHIPIIRAMHEVNPDAQFISWLYMPQVPTAWKYTIPEKLPRTPY